MKLPVLGIAADVLLPGEVRRFGRDRLVGWSGVEVGARVAAVRVQTSAEVPGLLRGRWAGVGEVVAADTDGVTLRGVGRGRVELVAAEGPPWEATLAAVGEPAEPVAVAEAAHRLMAAVALEAGRQGRLPGDDLSAALAACVRALTPAEKLGDRLTQGPAAMLATTADELFAAEAAAEARCALTEALEKLQRRPETGRDERRRLWGLVVDISRRLDVYDPDVTDGDDELGVGALRRKLQQAGLPGAVRAFAKREIEALKEGRSASNDHNARLGRLELIARLPWHPSPEPPLDLVALEAALAREHTGLDKPKQRILEHFAVRALGGSARGTVLCLHGPPGTGKTSIARAIAAALGRPFVRVPLGGVHDECEIRGHRTSFQAAAPGRILQGMSEAGTASPVMLLDELDKVGSERARSPAAALLEVLDPEQNGCFRDNYLGLPYDLSHVLFIGTANDLSPIHPALRDRLEVIDLDGYSLADKRDIARRHLLARAAKDCGLVEPPALDDATLEHLVERYTREPGVRQLERSLRGVFRARALARVRGGGADGPVTVAELARALGPPPYRVRTPPSALPPGVATGIAVGPEGGSLLFIEVARVEALKGELRLTGRVGEVMRESAHAALTRLRCEAARFGVDPEVLREGFHVHVPEGAIAKDGPSAGVALFCAMLSAARGVPVPADVAFSGEIDLRGQVLPVGGVRAKALAAERAGLRRLVLPRDNLADLPEGLAIDVVGVDHLDEVVDWLPREA